VSDATTTNERLGALESHLVRIVAELAETTHKNAKLAEDNAEWRKLVLHLREENERLKRGLLGQKAERRPQNDAQLSLMVLRLALGADNDGVPASEPPPPPPVEEQVIPEHTRRQPKRKALGDDLPRVRIELRPPEVEREGEAAFTLIGTDTREVLERRPASSVVVQLVYKKYVRKDRERNAATEVLVPETVELPIERGTAGPGMLADGIVRRWQDHQPLNRLEGIYRREGLPLAKSTLCTWHEALAALARPLVEAMFAEALREPYVCVDATGVLVQAKERCTNGHFWVLVAPGKHVLFRYSKRHDGAAVDALLPGFTGYLVSDAHAVYDHLHRSGAVVEVACWAHCRRYFFKALPSDPERAKLALGYIGALFMIERGIAGLPRAKREEVRRDKSAPILDAFFAWCGQQVDRVLDESPIAQGIGYARNQRQALCRFLEDGRLPIHNNASELNLRRQVVGRRNWLFLGSEDGADANTTWVSLLASCRLHDIEPLAYVRDLLCLLPRWPRHRLLELAPAYWAKTTEKPETKRSLDANVFRRVVLGQVPV
jgi:transposase